MNPYDKAHELARAIRASDAFVRLKQARERIEKDPATLRMLQDFRRQQLEFQTKQLSGQASGAEQEKLQRLAEVVMLNRDVSEYLEAEYRLGVFWADLQKILSDTMDEAILPMPANEEGDKP